MQLMLLTGCILSFSPMVEALRPSQYGSGSTNNYGSSSSGINPPPPSRAATNYDPNMNNQPPTNYDYGANDHESVEERLEKWRSQQQYKYEQQSPLDAMNPREEDGKMKLLASVSRGSIAMFFFILMWRSVHHYEMADGGFKGLTRLVMVIPPVLLFVGNMSGCVGSILSSGGLGKKRMKAVLNLNKLVEVCLMAYNIFRLVFAPSKLVLKEIYVGRTLSCFVFFIQCQLFTKVTWNAAQVNTNEGVATGDGGDAMNANPQENWAQGNINDQSYEQYQQPNDGRSEQDYDWR